MTRLSPKELLHFTELYDWASEWYADHLWGKLQPSRIRAIAGNKYDEGHAFVLGIFTFHRSGFVRHEAVRLLSKVNGGSELPFLLIRQNDWVGPITRDAQAAVSLRITDANVQNLAKSLEIVLHLNTLSRHNHSDTVSHVIDLLLIDRNDAILRRAIESTHRGVRRKVVRLGLKKPGDHLRRLVPCGLKSDDAIVRLNCCRCLPLIYADDRLLNALNGLTMDRFMPIRQEAIRQKSRHFPNTANVTWQDALLDRHSSIRELAWWHLKNTFHVDADPNYRNALQENPESLSALEGLSETGDESDLEYFKQLLTHSLPSRRCIGIQGLARVAKEASVCIILPCLRDEGPSVARAVFKGVRSYLSAVSADDLTRVAVEGKSPTGRHKAVRI